VLVNGGVLGNVVERYEDALGISVAAIGGGILCPSQDMVFPNLSQANDWAITLSS